MLDRALIKHGSRWCRDRNGDSGSGTRGADRACRRPGRRTAFRGCAVRRADVHLPTPLSRRTHRHARRAGSRRATGRGRRQPRLRRTGIAGLACGLAALHPGCPTRRRPPDRGVGMGAGGMVPGIVNRAALPQLLGRQPRRHVGRGRTGGCAGQFHERGRRLGDVGAQELWLSPPRPPSTHGAGPPSQTGGRSCIPRTRRGT